MITNYRDSYLDGKSFRGDASSVYAGEYDIGVWFSSWDKRCIAPIDSANVKAKVGRLVLFDDRDTQGLRDKHDRELKDYTISSCVQSAPITGRSIDITHIWNELFSCMVSVYRDKCMPVSIFVDASTAPRYYVLAILATALGYGLASKVSIGYAEGIYPNNEEDRFGQEQISFTSGQWRSVHIPGLEGNYDPSFSRYYLVSVGFEGWKTMRTVSRGDPDRVSLLFPDPGFQPGYVDKTRAANSDLIRQYRIPKEQIALAPAGDAIAAWKSLSEAALERINGENLYYICSGTKPHSIGLALRAMSLRRPAVLYNLPEGHPVLPTEANGTYWRYEIQSLTAPI